MLLAAFSASYESYRREVRALLPFVRLSGFPSPPATRRLWCETAATGRRRPAAEAHGGGTPSYGARRRCRRTLCSTTIVAVAESALPHALVTLTQKLVVVFRDGVENELTSAPTGVEVLPASP